MRDGWTSTQVQSDWDRARRKALWQAVVDALAGRSGDLVPLNEVKSRLNVRGSHYLGLQQVPLEKIVGSEGRYSDFDRRFLPRRDTTAHRWMSVDQAHYRDVNLPPVELYKIGDIYFVKDGNHRVSVARQFGQADIDAYVTEYEVDVPLDASFSMRDLLLMEEYSDFLDWTQLARFRPEQRIELSALGGYLELINHINTHRYYLSRERNEPVSAEEAVTAWYDNVYLPVVEAIRKHNILRHFPGRTEADLYLWIMQHRQHLLETSGVDPGPEKAALDYVSHHGRRSLLGSVGEAVQSLSQAVRGMAQRPQPAAHEWLDFVAWSQIDRLCPETEIRLSIPHDYQRLRTHIEEHQYRLGIERQGAVDLEEAVRDWCEHLYAPTVAAIRERGLLAHWPGHTDADLFLEAMNQLQRLKQQGGPAGPSEAVASLQDQLETPGPEPDSPDSLVDSARRLLRLRRR